MPLSDSLVLSSSEPTPEVPPGTLIDLIYEKFDSFPHDKVALLDDASGCSFSFRDLKRLTKQVASGLAKRGFGKGHVLSLFVTNNIQNAPIAHGTIATGGTLHLVKPAASQDELRFLFNLARPRIIVTSAPDAVLEAVRAISLDVQDIYVMGGSAEGCRRVEELLEDPGDANPWGRVEIDPREDVAVMMLTGGTTGMSKTVRVTHDTIKLSILESVPRICDVSAHDLSLGYLPFNHIFSFLLLHGVWLRQGVGVVNIAAFHPEKVLKSIENRKITRVGFTPTPVAVLRAHPYFQKMDLSSIKEIAMGATTISAEEEKIIRNAFEERISPGANICQIYAATEVAGSISWCQLSSHPEFKLKLGSTGPVSPSIEMRIISCDGKNSVCKTGEKGEICIRSPRALKEYYKNEEATRKAVVDGWYHSGDYGYFDEDEYVFVVDRTDDLIKHRDGIVSPTYVEGVLRSHLAIKDCAVIGRRGDNSGEEPMAFVVRREGCDVTEEDLLRFGKERLAPHEQLTGGVRFVETIPKSPAGKMLRSILRKQLQN